MAYEGAVLKAGDEFLNERNTNLDVALNRTKTLQAVVDSAMRGSLTDVSRTATSTAYDLLSQVEGLLRLAEKYQ